jgi:hypothetical protein
MNSNIQELTDPFTCGHCANKAPMTIVGKYSQIKSYEDDRIKLDWDEGILWELCLCLSCEGLNLRRAFYHEIADPMPEYEIVFPSINKPIIGLPPEINRAYEAALRVRDIDSNAFAVLLGRVLDKVCIDKKANGDSLHKRLLSLAQDGVIPQQLADMAHQLRQLRNIGAHADLGELTPTEVPVLEDLCRAILEYVYTAPALISRVHSRLDCLKPKNN